MSFFNEIQFKNISIYFWKLEENSEDLLKDIVLSSSDLFIFNSLKIEKKRLEFLAIRYLLKKANIPMEFLYYQKNGNPCLSNGYFISITHSFPFVVLAIAEKEIGIDIEKCTPRILNLASRFTDWQPLFLVDETDKILAFTQIWTIKEALFKIGNIPELDFNKNLIIEDFQPKFQYQKAQIIYEDNLKKYQIHTEFLEDFVWSLAY